MSSPCPCPVRDAPVPREHVRPFPRGPPGLSPAPAPASEAPPTPAPAAAATAGGVPAATAAAQVAAIIFAGVRAQAPAGTALIPLPPPAPPPPPTLLPLYAVMPGAAPGAAAAAASVAVVGARRQQGRSLAGSFGRGCRGEQKAAPRRRHRERKRAAVPRRRTPPPVQLPPGCAPSATPRQPSSTAEVGLLTCYAAAVVSESEASDVLAIFLFSFFFLPVLAPG